MESPQGWDLLTSSLAVWDLTRQADRAWAFLVLQELVYDAPGNRDRFFESVRREIERGPITGPTLSLRVALGLRHAGLTTAASDLADPWGRIAKSRVGQVPDLPK